LQSAGLTLNVDLSNYFSDSGRLGTCRTPIKLEVPSMDGENYIFIGASC